MISLNACHKLKIQEAIDSLNLALKSAPMSPNAWRASSPTIVHIDDDQKNPIARLSCILSIDTNVKLPQHLFLKIQYLISSEKWPRANEFRLGLPYESWLYLNLLDKYKLIKEPVYVDSWWCQEDDSFAFLMSCIDAPSRINKVSSWHDALVRAAAWLGSFHRKCEKYHLDFLTASQRVPRLNQVYFLKWIKAASLYLKDWPEFNVDPDDLYSLGNIMSSLLSAAPVTLVHGDFYPANILINSSQEIIPIDWESASLGPGIIDLASLVLNWDAELEASCLASYSKKRWPLGAPRDISLLLQAGKLYQLTRTDFERLHLDESYQNEWFSALSDALIKFKKMLSSL